MKDSRIKRIEETVDKFEPRHRTRFPSMDMLIALKKQVDFGEDKLKRRDRKLIEVFENTFWKDPKFRKFARILHKQKKEMPKEKSTNERLRDQIENLEKEKLDLLKESMPAKGQCRT